jgi:hypothetical protein
MLFDFDSRDIAFKLLEECNIIITGNDITITYSHNDMNINSYIHIVIENDKAIVYSKLLQNNNYSDDILRVIPYVLIAYIKRNYAKNICFIWYGNDYELLDQYYTIIQNMSSFEYYWMEHKTMVSKKYMYKLISNYCFDSPYEEIIQYMDINL